MSSKIFKIIWLIGIYSILGIILYLVIEYKVVWEHKDLNKYLYFYDCNNNLCTSPTIQKNYYSRVVCENDICPYITNIINDNVILADTNNSWIYDYKNGKIINDNYKNYEYLQNNYFIVTNELNKQGIIDLSGNITIDIIYDKIHNYSKNILLYEENNIYKVKNNDQVYELDSSYKDIILINDMLFAAKKDNKYNIYNYSNLNVPYSDNSYDYIYSYQDILITVNNKKIDIITTDLDSTLLMKIETFYEYKTEKERESLEISINEEYIYFNVFKNENECITYKYNTSQKKLV